MKIIFPRLRKRITILFVFILLIPALWYNISKLGFNDDEAIRAVVALEMDLSGNYIVPTINGLNYYAKPPLYNWILSTYCNVMGGYDEFNTRSLTILFLLLFCLFIYLFSKRYFTQRYALINALIFLTCGRVIFWDSLLGYIDLAYSMVCFLSFMVIYHYHKKQNYLMLFILSYSLMALGYLMKGLPSLLFQGISLFVLFYFFDKLKNALNWKHLLGLASAGLIIGSYYFLYNNYSPYQSVFDTLIDQSTRRTVIVKGIPETLKYILEFPFEYIYHFLPWSLLIILTFKRNLMNRMLHNPYIKYCWYLFLFNIPIYWISPGTIPRYVLMLMPLLFTVLLALYQVHREKNSLEIKIIDYVFLFTMGACVILAMYPLFSPRFENYPYRYWISIGLILTFSYLTYRYAINPTNRLLTFILCILFLRFGMNSFYLPEKAKESRLNSCKTEAQRIAAKYKDYPLFVETKSKIGNLATFYISNERNEILHKSDTSIIANSLMIVNSKIFEPQPYYMVIDSFEVCEKQSNFYIVQRSDESSGFLQE